MEDLYVGQIVYFVNIIAPGQTVSLPAIVLILGKGVNQQTGLSVNMAKLSVFMPNGLQSGVDAMHDELGKSPGTFHVERPGKVLTPFNGARLVG